MDRRGRRTVGRRDDIGWQGTSRPSVRYKSENPMIRAWLGSSAEPITIDSGR